MTNTQQSFKIVGISIRTNNQKAANDLGKLWSKFIGENTTKKIPNKISNDIYSIYTDYESDHSGDYTNIIGYRVSSLENIAAGLVSKEIPMSDYQKFTAKGKFPNCVQTKWGEIWNTEIDRRYTADFEVYSDKSLNMTNTEVDIFISVR
ncbi:MAG: GyrI-like domain-containing protein [Arcicella sp.]|nr:GyrI-like domain-containing protein [Arcicella sp.]